LCRLIHFLLRWRKVVRLRHESSFDNLISNLIGEITDDENKNKYMELVRQHKEKFATIYTSASSSSKMSDVKYMDKL